MSSEWICSSFLLSCDLSPPLGLLQPASYCTRRENTRTREQHLCIRPSVLAEGVLSRGNPLRSLGTTAGNNTGLPRAEEKGRLLSTVLPGGSAGGQDGGEVTARAAAA